MSLLTKLGHEARKMGLIALYFACCFGTVMLLKRLMLAKYDIHVTGLATAVVGALTVSKAVVLLERVPFGPYVRRKPVILDVALRSLTYTLGAAVLLFGEKAFESRHEYGGFPEAVAGVFAHRDVHNVWAEVICVGASLVGYNVFAVIQERLGEGALSKLFLTVTPDELRGTAKPHAN